MNSPYDLHPDDKRLAVVAAQNQGSAVQDEVVFFFNFADYLRKIAPGRRGANERGIRDAPPLPLKS